MFVLLLTIPHDRPNTLNSFILSVDDDISTAAAVGFTAFANQSRPYNIQEIVLYDSIITNYGGYYNPLTSSFICPVHGIYMFYVNTNVAGSDIVIQLNRNTINLVDSWARIDVSDDFNHGSNLVVTECDLGDVIWGRVIASNGQKTLYGSATRVTTFSGLLVSRM